MTEPKPLTRMLQLRIDRVSKEAFDETQRATWEERAAITEELRENGWTDTSIAPLFGVSSQYLGRMLPKIPKKKGKP